MRLHPTPAPPLERGGRLMLNFRNGFLPLIPNSYLHPAHLIKVIVIFMRVSVKFMRVSVKFMRVICDAEFSKMWKEGKELGSEEVKVSE
jgi:hypothetical protein